MAVANLYRAQPLLDFRAWDLHISTAAGGWLITTTQIAYAVAMMLLVPLGDIVNRRRLISIMMISTAAASTAGASAPGG